jgi:hypothetical protein
VIDLRQLSIGLTIGVVLCVLGLVPGLFQRLLNQIEESMENFRSQWTSIYPISPRTTQYEGQPTWLAGLGTALIVLTLLAYFS